MEKGEQNADAWALKRGHEKIQSTSCVQFSATHTHTHTSRLSAWQRPFRKCMCHQRLLLAGQRQSHAMVAPESEWNTYKMRSKWRLWRATKAGNCYYTYSAFLCYGSRSLWRLSTTPFISCVSLAQHHWLAHPNSSHCVFASDENTHKQHSVWQLYLRRIGTFQIRFLISYIDATLLLRFSIHISTKTTLSI